MGGENFMQQVAYAYRRYLHLAPDDPYNSVDLVETLEMEYMSNLTLPPGSPIAMIEPDIWTGWHGSGIRLGDESDCSRKD